MSPNSQVRAITCVRHRVVYWQGSEDAERIRGAKSEALVIVVVVRGGCGGKEGNGG